MLEQLLNHIEAHNLCQTSDRLLLAVSGGKDSMVMLHLIKEAGFEVGVAHCNFQLRGDESDGDEQFVKEFCRKLNIPFFSKRFETQTYANEHKLSLQMAARELRYSWFEEVMEQEKYTKLATAHHLNDSIETILLNWIKGGTTEALKGIPVKNEKIIRPLLFATRDAIDQYAANYQLQWREDSSNLTADYQRNFLRHRVIPLLKELNPSLEHTVQRALRKVAGESELIDMAFNDWKQMHVQHAHDKILISKASLVNTQQGAVLLFKLIQHLGFNFDVCEDVAANLHRQSGKKFKGAVHELTIDREHIIVTPTVDFWEEVIVNEGQGQACLGSWNLKHSELTITSGEVQMGVGKNEYEVLVDADKMTFPLHWRQWKQGDRFYPFGMEHRKKVSDLLIDRKVSVADKSRVTVLESGGEIIWVVGHRIDNRYKITSETKRALFLSVTPYFT